MRRIIYLLIHPLPKHLYIPYTACFTLNDYSFVYRLPKIRCPLYALRLLEFLAVYRLPFTVYRILSHSERSEESQNIIYFPLTLTLSPTGEGTILYSRLPFTVSRLPILPMPALRCPLHAFRPNHQ